MRIINATRNGFAQLRGRADSWDLPSVLGGKRRARPLCLRIRNFGQQLRQLPNRLRRSTGAMPVLTSVRNLDPDSGAYLSIDEMPGLRATPQTPNGGPATDTIKEFLLCAALLFRPSSRLALQRSPARDMPTTARMVTRINELAPLVRELVVGQRLAQSRDVELRALAPLQYETERQLTRWEWMNTRVEDTLTRFYARNPAAILFQREYLLDRVLMKMAENVERREQGEEPLALTTNERKLLDRIDIVATDARIAMPYAFIHDKNGATTRHVYQIYRCQQNLQVKLDLLERESRRNLTESHQTEPKRRADS